MYPLFFTFREIVNGAGFIAGVHLRGLALMTQEDDSWVMTGVQPGCFSEDGDTFEETRLRFRDAFKGIVFDIAEESANYDSFKAALEEILSQPNERAREVWDAAVDAVRQDTIALAEEIQGLERQFAGRGFDLQILEFAQPENSTAASNQTDEYFVADNAA